MLSSRPVHKCLHKVVDEESESAARIKQFKRPGGPGGGSGGPGGGSGGPGGGSGGPDGGSGVRGFSRIGGPGESAQSLGNTLKIK